ncbi:MAG: hypothetical protein JW892_13265 [Anaerolineae bacterium]|nr:hypothetical protein [Anaerolineae bacterium]
MKRKTLVVVIFAMMLILLMAEPVLAQGIIEPTDDTWVDLNDPNTNKDGFGLLIDYSNFPSYVVTRRTYLRFDLSGLTQDIDPNSVLRVRVGGLPFDTTLGLARLRITGDDWNGTDAGLGNETMLIWNNAPSVGTVLDSQSVNPSLILGTDIDFSGSALVAYVNGERTANGGDDIVSFAIEFGCELGGCSPFADSMAFDDREQFYNTGAPPRLIYTDPTAVTLVRFEASPDSNQVRVEWETATELDNLGFNLYRGESATGPWVKLNESFIPAQQPGLITGAVYEWLDEAAPLDTTVFYRLEDVDIRGVSTFHGPVSATPAGPAAIGLRSFGASPHIAPVAVLGVVFFGALLPAARRLRSKRRDSELA